MYFVHSIGNSYLEMLGATIGLSAAFPEGGAVIRVLKQLEVHVLQEQLIGVKALKNR
jgi:hypothetical protein